MTMSTNKVKKNIRRLYFVSNVAYSKPSALCLLINVATSRRDKSGLKALRWRHTFKWEWAGVVSTELFGCILLILNKRWKVLKK